MNSSLHVASLSLQLKRKFLCPCLGGGQTACYFELGTFDCKPVVLVNFEMFPVFYHTL